MSGLRRAVLALLVALPVLVSCAAREERGTAVLMRTALGDITVAVDTERAPVTAGNFLALVDGGYFDGASFYRTVSPANDNGSPPISVIQGGIGDAPAPFAPIAHEPTSVTGLRHTDGSISMARAGTGTATTEFFICIGAQPALDYGGQRNADGQGFAVFGRVVGGMDVVRTIHAAPADAPTDIDYFRGQLLGEPVVIETVTRVSPVSRRPARASGTAP